MKQHQSQQQLPRDVFNALIDGLTELHLLRLPYAPAAKGLPATAMVWEKAFLARCEWHDKTAGEDVTRITIAFAEAAASAERWLLPKDVLDRLPPRKPPPALPPPSPVPCPPEVAELLNGLTDTIKMTKA